jgi:hypothetical protein
MFVTKRAIEHLAARLESINERYWELDRAHRRLLDELGYVEEQVIEHKVLRKKGGPEKGEAV